MDDQCINLCDFCRQVNFEAILTPREWDLETGTVSAVYRPEYTGSGGVPILKEDWAKRRRNHAFGYDLPRVRVAKYDDLSDSSDADDARAHDDYVVGGLTQTDPVTMGSSTEHLQEANAAMAAELSGIEDEDDNPPSFKHRYGQDESVQAQRGANEEDAGARDHSNYSDEDLEGESASTWSDHSHFLDFDRVDIEAQAQGKWDYIHGLYYYLGTIWDVRKRRGECILCLKFWRKMRENQEVKQLHLTKSRCILKLVELRGQRSDGSGGEVVTLKIIFIYAYKLDDPRGYNNWTIRTPMILHGTHRDIIEMEPQVPHNNTTIFDDRMFGEARAKPARCDFALFKGWLNFCETKHTHNPLQFDGRLQLRLIDVHKRRLIEWEGMTEEAPRYVALSYVWGKKPHKRMLTRRQLRSFGRTGALGEQNLDCTFNDAIKVVYEIGERYLWIDSLCIIQDDKADKATQIPQMHKIYGNAVLTIVAASGKDADAGLKGVGRHERGPNHVFALDLENIRLKLAASTPICWSVDPMNGDIAIAEDYLLGSTYKTRAWTYQEAFLSPRLLIFNKEQVYFECETCTWCEETHWESSTIDFNGLRALKKSEPNDMWTKRFVRQAYEAGERHRSAHRDLSFAMVVREYSSRDLTYGKDALNACSGILASIAQMENLDFSWGLRTRFFGNDLLFNPTDAVPKRFYYTSGKSPFPSWAWVSWYGPIKIANETNKDSSDLVQNVIPCDGVKCYIIQVSQDGITTLRTINPSGGWRFQHQYVRFGEGIYGPEDLHPIGQASGALFKRFDDFGDDEAKASNANVLINEENSHDSRAGGSDDINGYEDIHAELRIVRSVLQTSASGLRLESRHARKIPSYPQEITLSELKSHHSFERLTPGFHIIFRTFSSLVLLRTDYDGWVAHIGSIRRNMSGTRLHRDDGIIGDNCDEIQRSLYILRQKSDAGASTTPTFPRDYDERSENHPCPCCGEDSRHAYVPDGFELGPYAGRLPPLSRSWDPRSYEADVPDGVYRLIYMNNNQLPMFGHLLVYPHSRKLNDVIYNWDKEIMERVSGALGPPDILFRAQQEKYEAQWGTVILG